MTSPDRELTLHLGRTATGRVSEWWWRNQAELVLPASGLSTWLVENRDGTTLMCRRFPPETLSSTKYVEKLLDNEIRALSRLAHRYERADYPAELPQLVGYNFDSADPYLLCTPFRGTCAEQVARTLLSDQRISFAMGLLRALAQLAAVDLVHGAVDLTTARWDDTGVQLINFEHAAVIGEPRRVADRSRWASPDQIQSIGCAHPGDDVFAAGLVIYELFTGIRPEREDRLDFRRGGPMLRELLTGIFHPEADHRPSSAELLHRLGAETDLPTPVDVEGPLRPGRVRFEQARRRKYPSSTDTADNEVPPDVSALPLNRRLQPPDVGESRTRPIARTPFKPKPIASRFMCIALVTGLLVVFFGLLALALLGGLL